MTFGCIQKPFLAVNCASASSNSTFGHGNTEWAAIETGVVLTACISAPEDVKLVMNLFDSFKKQIRVGYFEVPNALALTEAQ